ncbi:MAG: Eco57I restriction-modification methylase domain-containing protein [Candidatus Limnocylindria bacterium]
MNLRPVRSIERAVELARLLGYEANPLPYDGSGIGLAGETVRLNSDRSPAKGYGLLISEIDSVPRSLRTLGRKLVEQFHDRPLALLGVRNGSEGWNELVVVRPRLIEGGGGSVSVAKLTIDVERPTAHDAEVVSGLGWDASDPDGAHARIDKALDAERVTRKFFEGLNQHYQRLLAAVTKAGETDAAVLGGLQQAGGADRVALRVVTQVLFCYFLQRKGLLEGDRAWLTRRFQASLTRGGAYYQRVLEPLFYEALAKPGDLRPDDWRRESLPFLNGGLFERHYGDVSLPIPDEVLSADEGLLGFLDQWTFTVSEEAADESEVAVDPEMLGKIFESLIPENVLRKEGTVYTPRPVVQFMCREALVPYLEREAGLDENGARRLLLDDEAFERTTEEHGSEASLALARRVDVALDRIRVIDPAVGSGAFLLGMMSEIVRMRRLCNEIINGREAVARDLWLWKLNAIERSLFGVDVNATAIELCRLRLWLSLLVEEETGHVHPLPNLEYRTVCADSLRDFVAGVEVQQTRSGALTLGFDIEDPDRLVALRESYFEAWQPAEKKRLRAELEEAEDELVQSIFARAIGNARAAAQAQAKAAREQGEAALEKQLPDLHRQYQSRDRVFPAFLPAFHAPDVARAGGWDIAIANPPYVGRKEVAQRFDASYRADLEKHYGRTYDLMIHFAFRAFELARTGGIVSMIFNDSIFTSTDATSFRRFLLPDSPSAIRLASVVRTRCFEGKAVNGGVIVAVEAPPGDRDIRYVENHGRPTEELTGASVAVGSDDSPHPVGRSELWAEDRRHYVRLPHRPLFRPSPEALVLLDRFEDCAAWGELGRISPNGGADWELLSETRALERWKEGQRRAGFFDQLRQRRFVMLGLVTDSGVGLQTSDDRRFLAAIEGTQDAERAIAHRSKLEELVLAHPDAGNAYSKLRASGHAPDDALILVAEQFGESNLRWPKSGLIRIAPRDEVVSRPLTDDEIKSGLRGRARYVAFEKGDDTAGDGGARWCRVNPLVIDWSEPSVELLRRRSRESGSRRPYLRNEHMWGRGGITWNRVTSYLRVRLVPEGSLFSDKTPVIHSTEDWLTTEALMVLLNSRVADFAVRTLLGSRMQIELGDIRRLPVPVLDDAAGEELTDLGRRALSAKTATDVGDAAASLDEIEDESEERIRDLYGLSHEADLWVVR